MVAHPVGRERKPPGPTPPAHHPTLIGYTTPRDAIRFVSSGVIGEQVAAFRTAEQHIRNPLLYRRRR